MPEKLVKAHSPGRGTAESLSLRVADIDVAATSKHLDNSRYRADVDGLRAVAVILVILYHLKASLAPGGFVGVDIFFVISGYVVTGSIVGGAAAKWWQVIARFWRRRLLRIVPAVVFMVFASDILLALLRVPFPVLTYQGEYRTGIASLLGLGNIYLFRRSSDYFEAADGVNPFIHTWSLGVEEQFYLLFAVIFVGILGLIRNSEQRRRVSFLAMLLLGVASYLGFVWIGPKDALAAYYLIPFRFWEIAAGSAIAYWKARLASAKSSAPSLSLVLQTLALICVVAAVWVAGENAFQVWRISVAALGALLLIAIGSPEQPIARFLSSRVMVTIGVASYSLYLWHFPILQLWRTETGLHSFGEYAAAVITMVGAALLSYKLIERPFRYSRASFARTLLPVILCGLVGTAAAGYLLQRRPGAIYSGSRQQWFGEWWPSDRIALLPKGQLTEAACLFHGDQPAPTGVPAQCASTPAGTAVKKPTLLALGDSHTWADWPMDAYGARAGAYNLATVAYAGCIPDGRQTLRASCNDYWRRAPAIIRRTLARGDTLMLAILWPVKDIPRLRNTLDSIDRFVKEASVIGAGVLIEAPPPRFERPAYLCTAEWFRMDFEGCSVARSDFERERRTTMDGLAQLARRYPNVRIWDPAPMLCSGERCDQLRDGHPVFRDEDHLSFYQSNLLGHTFLDFWRAAQKT